MLTDLDKEIVDKLEQAIRLGFQIARDEAYAIGEGYGCNDCDYTIAWCKAEQALEEKITEMRIAALGQEAAKC